MPSMLLVLLLCCFWLVTTSAYPLNEEPQQASRIAQVITTCVEPGTFAITFDDGPYRYQGDIVHHLNRASAKGTFFVNGMNNGCIYDRAEELRATFRAGHVIGSHTWSHVDVTTLSEHELRKELSKLEVALKKILGIRPLLFRPPFGAINEAALKVLHDRGYTVVTWSLDSRDSLGESPSDSKSLYQEQANAFPAPGISLNHETYASTAKEVAPYAISVLGEAGYKLISTAECRKVKPYKRVKGREERNDSWRC